MRTNELYCMYCGHEQDGTIQPTGELYPCENCKKKPICEANLLMLTNILEITVKGCNQCKRFSIMSAAYCFNCGNQF